MSRPASSAELRAEVERKTEAALALLREVASKHAPVALATSLGAEDMLLTDLVARNSLPIGIFTLDTGRLNEETYALLAAVQSRYRLAIDIHSPDRALLEPWVRAEGINAFYDSLEARQACCRIRKLEPLARALAGKGAWVTGLRAAQSVTRQDLEVVAFDAAHGLPKISPLAAWSEEEVWAYIDIHRVPYNALHDAGYPSIGCAPCTRAIAPGEDLRAGRWWWENPATKECGLHAERAKA